MYITTRTRYVENANEHVRKNEMQLQENNITAQQMTWVASAEKKFARMAHTTFLSKRFLKSNWGKFWIGHAIRLVYAKGFRSAWLVTCFQSRPELSFVSFQTASCLQLLRHTPWVGWEACWTGWVKNFKWLPWLTKVETLVHLKERRGHKLSNSFNRTSSPCLNFLWRIQNNEVEIKFHHSTSLTSSVNKTVCQKAGNTKETYSFKFACFCWTRFQKQEKWAHTAQDVSLFLSNFTWKVCSSSTCFAVQAKHHWAQE